MAAICHMCHGKGRFALYQVIINDKKITIPEQKCLTCDGKGVISINTSEERGNEFRSRGKKIR